MKSNLNSSQPRRIRLRRNKSTVGNYLTVPSEHSFKIRAPIKLPKPLMTKTLL